MDRARSASPARFALCALVVAALVATAAQAQMPHRSGLDQNVLAGGGPPTTYPPISKPFFLGWSKQIAGPAELLKTPKESGGVGADPSNGWVYAGSSDGHLLCIDGGKIVWTTDIGGLLLAPPTVHRNVVVAGTAEGVVYILNKVTGQRLARAILGEELITQPVVDEDAAGHMHAYVGSSVESLFAINVDDGLKMWRAHRDAPSGFTIFGFARPVVTPTAIYAGFADGTVEALDPATGVVKWEKHLSPAGDMLDVDALAFNGVHLFATSFSGGVFGLEPATGDVVWQTKVLQANRLVTDGLNVYAGGSGVWVGLRADDGFLDWKFSFGGEASTTAGALCGPLLVFAEQDGAIFFVDRRSGKGVGRLETGEGFSSAPTVVGNVLFALSSFGRIYSAVVAP